MAAKAKARTIVVRLYSQAGTGYYYTTTRRRTAIKLTRMKYDPIVNQHVIFSEKK
ncbi:hypothetical protein DFJ74DRAFT_651887 [Hyaloraphidium curvatum]|nr:hypothetical protein DFJ74DRAFT_651887 [Hyaloraphidium curvatum]